MLYVTSVSPGVVPYFLDGRAAGRWNEGASRLLGLTGEVGPGELGAVLRGCDPRTGAYLPAVRSARRRSGWDLVFAAPKSFSLMAGSAGDAAGAELRTAHVRAVDGVVAHLAARARTSGPGPSAPTTAATGLVAAAFDHRLNSASEPHIHTHVLIANLTRAEDRWRAVRSEDWYIGRPALAARYHLELRHHAAELGWDLDWRLRPDGMADLAGIPRAAVRATSTPGRAAVAGGRFAGRTDGPSRSDWETTARAAGMSPLRTTGRPGDPAAARRPGQGFALPRGLGDRGLGDRGLEDPGLEDPALHRAVTSRLSIHRSDFRADDVVIALASSHRGGATSEQVDRWVARYCAASHPVPSPTRAPRWTTGPARRLDEELTASLCAEPRSAGRPPAGIRSSGSGGPVGTSGIERVLAGSGHLGPAEQAIVVSLTAGRSDVHVLGSDPGRTDLLTQADVLDACREIWVADGRRVMVSSPTPDAARRWGVLSGLEPYRPGSRPDVLVVDRADRRPTTELARLARIPGVRLVFVEGGTMPRLTNPASRALQAAAAGYGRHLCGPHPPWTAAVPKPGADGSATGRAAAAAVLGRWLASSEPLLMVGLGREEVIALNRAAAGKDPAAAASGRFEEGDRVVVHRSGPGRPPYGTFGTVAGRSREGATGIRWDGRPGTALVDGRALDGVGLGYAVSTRLSERTDAPLAVLGPASALDRARVRVVSEVIPAPAREHRGMGRAADRGRDAWTAG